MDITGKIIKVFPTETFDSGFQKTEFVLEYADNPEYPQTVIFQLTGKNHDLLTRFKFSEGHDVKVSFNIRGRAWTPPGKTEPKYFNSLDAWRVDPAESATETLYQPPATQADPIPEAETVADDDLPF